MRRDHAHLLSAASEAMERTVSWRLHIRLRGGGTEGPRGQLNRGCGCARYVGAPKPEPQALANMLVAHLAVFSAGLDQAHCQPVGRLTEVHEHCSGTI